MPQTDPPHWPDRLRRTLALYDEPLLRQVAGRLVKPRGHWPADELVRRMAETVGNAPMVDRRLKELPPECRQVLAAVGLSRRPHWHVGNLVELAAALGHPDGLAVVTALLESGLLFPELPEGARCRSLDAWLAHTDPARLVAFTPPDVTRRALAEELPLPDLSAPDAAPDGPAREADGLEWLLRLSALVQQVAAAPLRRTQQGELFKRDLDRLRQGGVLGAQPADVLEEIPDLEALTVALGVAAGALGEEDGEIRAAGLPAAWGQGLPEALADLWSALPTLRRGPAAGEEGRGNPYPSAALLAVLLLGRAPADGWCPVPSLCHWVRRNHPYWKPNPEAAGQPAPPGDADPTGVRRFLLDLAYQLRLVQAARGGDGGWLVRLSPLGRWLLSAGERPAAPAFPKTLLVQPNLEILLYRQGLTPELIARLGRLAAWKGLGAACNLQLEPETVYAALQSGETFEGILQALEQHGMKPTPAPVVDSLRTWAQKRERITVYAAGTVVEFLTPGDLEEAIARGVPLVRVTDQLAVIAREADIEYRHFRLLANRDYTLPPEPCVTVLPDGVTLEVDFNRSDLLLETELRRFAEGLAGQPGSGLRQFRLTPDSLAGGAARGLTADALANWFLHRTGQGLTPAARLLLSARDLPPPALRRRTILEVDGPEAADGLCQWPPTAALIEERVGPRSLAVADDNVARLRELLAGLGVSVPGP